MIFTIHFGVPLIFGNTQNWAHNLDKSPLFSPSILEVESRGRKKLTEETVYTNSQGLNRFQGVSGEGLLRFFAWEKNIGFVEARRFCIDIC